MKLNRKKIFAREFLLFLSCLFVSTIAFIGVYPYNYVINSKIDKFEENIIHLREEVEKIEKPINVKLSKQMWFYEKWQGNSDLAVYNNYSELWERLEHLQKQDSIDYKWNNVWRKPVLVFIKDLGFNNSSQFDKFIKDNSLNKDELNIILKADTIKTEITEIKNQVRRKENKVLGIEDQLNFALLFLIIVGIIAFPIRFLYYSVKWSMKTLKQKE